MLHPAQEPGSAPAIELSSERRTFVARWVADGLMLANLPVEPEHVQALGTQAWE